MSRIELKNISKSFENKPVLQNINLVVEEGEMVSLLGPSGCGKTTTLKIIAGLVTPDFGDILLNETSIMRTPIEKRGTVVVFQDYLLFPHMNVADNISFGLKMSGVEKQERLDRVKEILDLVELNGHEDKYPRELSGGQKQRVAIARAIAVRPKVLLLDEPFSNLDTRLRETMREFICDIQRRLRITTILVTHDKEEALMTSDRVAIMLEGRIRQYDAPYTLYEKPCCLEVADFIGETNYICGEIKEGVFESTLGNFNVGLGSTKKAMAMIRPEKIGITSIGENQGIQGKIIGKRYAGNRIYYVVLAGSTELKCTSESDNNFEVGQKVSLNIGFKKAVFFNNE